MGGRLIASRACGVQRVNAALLSPTSAACREYVKTVLEQREMLTSDRGPFRSEGSRLRPGRRTLARADGYPPRRADESGFAEIQPRPIRSRALPCVRGDARPGRCLGDCR